MFQCLPFRRFPALSRFSITLLIFACIAIRVTGQSPALDAPLPTQIAAAKHVFISFGGADASLFPGWYSGTPDRVYSEFYFAMKGWGRFDLLLEPATADLIMEIRLIEPPTGVQGRRPVFQVMIIDPKTRAVLWVLNDDLKLEFALKKHRDRLFTESMGGVIADLKALVERRP